MCAIEARPKLGSLAERALENHRKYWKEQALSVAPADRPMAEQAVRKAYAASNLAPPRQIIWFDSPLSGAMAAALLTKLSPLVYDTIEQHTVGHAGRRMWDQVNERGSKDWWMETFLRLQQHPETRGYANLFNGVMVLIVRQLVGGSEVSADLGGVRDAAMRKNIDAVYEKLNAELSQADFIDMERKHNMVSTGWGSPNFSEHRFSISIARNCGGGSFNAQSLQFLDFCRQSGLRLPAADGMLELARSCGFWWPLKEFCILTNRPKLISIDRQGRFHSLRSRALEYRDGWGMYSYHGTPVPERFVRVLRKRSVHEVLAEPNIELKRLMVEAYGYERFLNDSSARVLDRDDCGTLYFRQVPNDEPIVMVQVTNSTPEPDGSYRRYFLRVPPWIESARAAVAWTFGLSADAYEPHLES